MNFTVIGLWSEMGVVARAVVIVLLAMSTYSLAIAVERLLAFRRARVSSAAAARLLDAVARYELAGAVGCHLAHDLLDRAQPGVGLQQQGDPMNIVCGLDLRTLSGFACRHPSKIHDRNDGFPGSTPKGARLPNQGAYRPIHLQYPV